MPMIINEQGSSFWHPPTRKMKTAFQMTPVERNAVKEDRDTAVAGERRKRKNSDNQARIRCCRPFLLNSNHGSSSTRKSTTPNTKKLANHCHHRHYQPHEKQHHYWRPKLRPHIGRIRLALVREKLRKNLSKKKSLDDAKALVDVAVASHCCDSNYGFGWCMKSVTDASCPNNRINLATKNSDSNNFSNVESSQLKKYDPCLRIKVSIQTANLFGLANKLTLIILTALINLSVGFLVKNSLIAAASSVVTNNDHRMTDLVGSSSSNSLVETASPLGSSIDLSDENSLINSFDEHRMFESVGRLSLNLLNSSNALVDLRKRQPIVPHQTIFESSSDRTNSSENITAQLVPFQPNGLDRLTDRLANFLKKSSFEVRNHQASISDDYYDETEIDDSNTETSLSDAVLMSLEEDGSSLSSSSSGGGGGSDGGGGGGGESSLSSSSDKLIRLMRTVITSSPNDLDTNQRSQLNLLSDTSDTSSSASFSRSMIASLVDQVRPSLEESSDEFHPKFQSLMTSSMADVLSSVNSDATIKLQASTGNNKMSSTSVTAMLSSMLVSDYNSTLNTTTSLHYSDKSSLFDKQTRSDQPSQYFITTMSTISSGGNFFSSTSSRQAYHDGITLLPFSELSRSFSNSMESVSTISGYTGNETSFDEPLGWLEIAIIVLKVLILGSIILAAVFGNLLVIIAVFRHHRLRITTNYFIVSLAFADILVALFAMTFNASVVISGKWLFNMWICDFWNSCDVLFSTASIMHLSCISYDRYYAIIKPLEYPMKVTGKRVAYMLACVWISSALISYIPIFTGFYTTELALENRQLYPDLCEWIVNIPYALISSSVSFWLPCSIMLWAYFKIYKEAIKQEKFIYRSQQMVNQNHHPAPKLNKTAANHTTNNNNNQNYLTAQRHSSTSENNVIQIQSTVKPPHHRNSHAEDPESGSSTPTKRTISKMKREHKAAKTLGIIMGAFILCWLPFFIWYVTSTICGSNCNTPKLIVDLLFWVGYLNSAMNPIIYAYFNRDFREAFKETLRDMFCCCFHFRCLEAQRNDAIAFSCTYRSTMEVGLVENKYVKDS